MVQLSKIKWLLCREKATKVLCGRKSKSKKKKGNRASKTKSSADISDVQKEYSTHFSSLKTVLTATEGKMALKAATKNMAFVDSGCNGIFINDKYFSQLYAS